MKKIIFYVTILLLYGGCSVKDDKINRIIINLDDYSKINIQNDNLIKANNTILTNKKELSNKTIKISSVDFKTKFSNDSMIYQSDGSLYEFAKNKWGLKQNDMVERVLLRSIADSSIFKAVVLENSSAKCDYLLESQIYKMWQVFESEKSYFVFEIKLDLVSLEDNNIIFSKLLTYKENANENSPIGGAIAFEKIINRFRLDLINLFTNKNK